MNAGVINNFIRKESKYLLTGAQMSEMLKAMAPYCVETEYGKSSVVSVYYDNDEYELLNRSVEKPMYKEKLRVRAYAPAASENAQVFAEIKKKYDGTVFKRRVSGPYGDIRKMLACDDFVLQDADNQIRRELQWMMRRYGLKPKIWIGCERAPYQARDGSDLRITFDSDLRYQTEQPDLRYEGAGLPILPPDIHIMEIKSGSGLPIWLCDALSSNKIYPRGFSKVGTAFEQKIQSMIRE